MLLNSPSLPILVFLTMEIPSSPRRGTSRAKAQPSSSATKKSEVCNNYNKGACKWGDKCNYKHKCSKCGKLHPLTQCDA